MSQPFTKEEAIDYLGEVFMITKRYYRKENKYEYVEPGEVGKVQSIDVWDGEIKLCLDIYGNYYSVTKQQFDDHCVLLKPEIIAHHASDNLSH